MALGLPGEWSGDTNCTLYGCFEQMYKDMVEKGALVGFIMWYFDQGMLQTFHGEFMTL